MLGLSFWVMVVLLLGGWGRWWAVAAAVGSWSVVSWWWLDLSLPHVGWLWAGALGLLLTIPLVPRQQRRRQAAALQRHRLRLEELQRARHEWTERLERLAQENRRYDAHITSLVELYQFTKQAATLLRVPDLFGVLQEHAARQFSYSRLTFIPLAPGPHGLRPQGAIFSSRPTAEGRTPELLRREAEELLPYERWLVLHIQHHPVPRWITWPHAAQSLPELPWPREHQTLAWVPLTAEGQMTALVIVADLPEDFLHQVVVIARQLALQLQRVMLYQQVEALAVTDGLTRLFVRRHFVELAREELARAQRHRHPVSLLLVDVDHFKAMNDQYGHLAGDVLLRSVGGLLHANVREIDLVARYGGEEFAALLLDTDKAAAQHVAERIRAAIAQEPLRAYDEEIPVTVSVGLATCPDDAEELMSLLELADRALYQAKEAGRNRVVAYA